jgi:hypothetical protein
MVLMVPHVANANHAFFLQQRSHLQAKKLGEDGVGECHLIECKHHSIKRTHEKVAQN